MGSMEDFRRKIDAAERAFRVEYKDGGSYLQPGASQESFNIDVSYFDPTRPKENYTAWHGAKIQVHGDQNLRDRILIELQSEPAGYAVNVPGDGGIDIRTVGPTRRSAIVNWLYTARGWAITNAWTDDMIEQAWRSSREYRTAGDPAEARIVTAYCIKLVIQAYQGKDANVSETPNA